MRGMMDRARTILGLFLAASVLLGSPTVLAQEITTNIVDCAVDVGLGPFICGERHGNNLLVITNGGTVKSQTGYIGRRPSSHGNMVIITGAGALWNDTTGFDIGDRSCFNSLILADGGKLNCMNGYLGYYVNANSNSATVSGSGAVWNIVEKLHIGYGGSFNVVVITNGGVVNCGEGALIGPGPGNLAIVTGSGSVWNVSGGDLVVGGGPGSSLILSDGGSVAGSVVVRSGSTVGGSGALGSLTMAAGSLLSPGDPTGKLTIKGNMTLDGGATNVFELGKANTPGVDYDHVEVLGTLNIANVDFASFAFTANDGFGPGLYRLFHAAGLSGNLGAKTRGTVKNLNAVLRKDAEKNDLLLEVSR